MAQPILVGTDGSPAAQGALSWAAQNADDSTVMAAHVLTYSAEFSKDLSPTGLTTWRQRLQDRLEQEWVQPLKTAGATYRSVLVEDDSVAAGLLRLAADNEVSLIVLGAHGHDNLSDRLLGSVTYKVSHRAERPVVIVPADWVAGERQTR